MVNTIQANTLNKEEYDFTNITEWHEKGYTGKGVKIVLNDIGYVQTSAPFLHGKVFDPLGTVNREYVKSSHAQLVTQVIHDIAPEAEIYVFNTPRPTEPIKWATENDAQLINRSLGGSYTNDIDELSRISYNNNIFMSVASGNEDETLTPFANSDYWYTIGAVSMENGLPIRTSYSSWGEGIDIMEFSAILTCTYICEYHNASYFHGTSASTPFVTGMLSLYYEKYKEEHGEFPSIKKAREFVAQNTIDLEAKGYDIYTGHGLFVLPKLDCPIVAEKSNPLAVEMISPDKMIRYVHADYVREYINDKKYNLSKCGKG
jgi:hypothetical protein